MFEGKNYDAAVEKYLPTMGEGDNKATQIVTAVNRLVYKWYNDGDVYDNVHSGLDGWANDLSAQANWLRTNTDAAPILDRICGIYNDGDYEDILNDLCDHLLNLEDLEKNSKSPKVGTIYECSGPFEFCDIYDDDDDDDDEW